MPLDPKDCVPIPEWQKRVIDEKSELDEKLNKLIAYLSDDENHKKMSAKHADMLYRQLNAMAGYANILNERIKDFNND